MKIQDSRIWVVLVLLDSFMIIIYFIWMTICFAAKILPSVLPMSLKAAYKQFWKRSVSLIRYLHEVSYSGSTPNFEYTELLSHQSIRLLSIQPGQSFSPLSCTLQEASLRDEPSFVAVSYTWEQFDIFSSFLLLFAGTVAISLLSTLVLTVLTALLPGVVQRPLNKIGSVLRISSLPEDILDKLFCNRNRSRLILCNERYMYVTANLYALLLQLRQEDDGTKYWIDAISIDQENIPERNRHLILMTQIYSSARHVVAWLGPCPSLLDSSSTMGRVHLPVEQAHLHECKTSADALHLPLRPYARAHLLGSHYFSRVWIVQECALPEEIMFMIGRFKLTPAEMMEVARLTNTGLKYSTLFEPLFPSSSKMMISVIQGRDQYQETKSWTLSRYLLSIAGHCSTDERDFVYAGLGLMKFQDTHLLATGAVVSGSVERFDDGLLVKPSYDVSYVEVLVACGARLLQEEGLYALSFANNGADDWLVHPPKIPTWVPNIYALGEMTPLRSEVGKMFAAGGRSKVSVTVTPEHQLLLNSGAELFDTVKTKFPVNTSDVVDTILAILEAHPQIYATGESTMTAIACSLVAGYEDKDVLNAASTTRELIEYVDEYLKQRIILQKSDAVRVQQISFLAKIPIVGQQLNPLDSSAEISASQAKHTRFKNEILRHTQLNQDESEFIMAQEDCADQGETSQACKPSNETGSNLAKVGSDFWSRFLQDIPVRTTFQVVLEKVCRNRTLFVTERGYIGLGSEYLKEGFSVVIPTGSCMPYAMKETASSEAYKHYRLYGEVYVHGIMNGERVTSEDWNPVPIWIE